MTRKRFYNRTAGALDEFVRAHLESDPTEQMDLLEEVALARARCEVAVAAYSMAIQSDSSDAIAPAGELLEIRLREVRSAVKDAVAVSVAQADKFSAHTLRHIVLKITRLANETFGEDDPRVKQFHNRLRNEIKMPREAADSATELTPDGVRDMVREMDASVGVESFKRNGNGHH